MKILFVIQGEGRGHLMQALSLRQKLEKEGHQVVGALVGKSPARHLPDFFTRRIGVPVYPFESPNFLPAAANKRVNLLWSFLYNLLRLHKYLQSIRYIRKMIARTEVDVVVNFYELLTGLSYSMFPPKAKMICIAHQYLFLHPEYQFPELKAVPLALLKLFTRVTALGSVKKLALSFRKMREDPRQQLVVVPPLLRDEVLNCTPVKGDYLHGYLLNSGFSEEVKCWHAQNPEVPLHIFWDKKNVTEIVKIDDTLSFHPLHDQRFLQFMAGSKGYATTAGFESVCEAMYLGKPVLMVPAHIEQTCNAFDAAASGAGLIADSFDLDRLLQATDQYQTNPNFKHWVKQADWLILHEFRADLLLAKQKMRIRLWHLVKNELSL